MSPHVPVPTIVQGPRTRHILCGGGTRTWNASDSPSEISDMMIQALLEIAPCGGSEEKLMSFL